MKRQPKSPYRRFFALRWHGCAKCENEFRWEWGLKNRSIATEGLRYYCRECSQGMEASL